MPLPPEIVDLLNLPENGAGAPSLDAIESTLTTGYAAKLGQRLSSADGDLNKLRTLLVALRTRADEVRTAA